MVRMRVGLPSDSAASMAASLSIVSGVSNTPNSRKEVMR